MRRFALAFVLLAVPAAAQHTDSGQLGNLHSVHVFPSGKSGENSPCLPEWYKLSPSIELTLRQSGIAVTDEWYGLGSMPESVTDEQIKATYFQRPHAFSTRFAAVQLDNGVCAVSWNIELWRSEALLGDTLFGTSSDPLGIVSVFTRGGVIAAGRSRNIEERVGEAIRTSVVELANEILKARGQ